MALLNSLQQYNLQEGETDSWTWRGPRDGLYSVKAAYKEISKRNTSSNTENAVVARFEGVWKARAPFKAKLSVWRLLRDRLPMKDNLFKRNIATQIDPAYCCCKRKLESAIHFFFQCSEMQKIWNSMVKWTGASWAPPIEVCDHRICFSSLLGTSKVEHRLNGLWICVNWVLWKWRKLSRISRE